MKLPPLTSGPVVGVSSAVEGCVGRLEILAITLVEVSGDWDTGSEGLGVELSPREAD